MDSLFQSLPRGVLLVGDRFPVSIDLTECPFEKQPHDC